MRVTSEDKKVVLIGLDGLSRHIIDRYGHRMKAIRGLVRKHGIHYILSPLPITPAAWTSIATGKDPTHHGIVDFIVREEGSYDLSIVNAKMKTSASLWTLVSHAGGRAVIINYPVTYPPERIKGLMVSGLLTPSIEGDFVYPKGDKARVIKWCEGDYRIFLRTPFEGHGESFLRDIIEVDRCKVRVALNAMREYDWDLLAIVFMGLDNASHMYWHYMDRDHPRHGKSRRFWDPIGEVVEGIDRYVGEIIGRLDRNTEVVIISDHGFGPLHYYIDLNRFLMKKKYLKLIEPGRGLSWDNIDWPHTEAYSLGYLSPIYINLEGREAEGRVPRTRYREKRREIERMLRDLASRLGVDLTRLVHSEDIGTGPFQWRVPDIMAVFDGMKVIGKGVSHEDISQDNGVEGGEKTNNTVGGGVMYVPKETGTHGPEAVCISTLELGPITTIQDVFQPILRHLV